MIAEMAAKGYKIPDIPPHPVQKDDFSTVSLCRFDEINLDVTIPDSIFVIPTNVSSGTVADSVLPKEKKTWLYKWL